MIELRFTYQTEHLGKDGGGNGVARTIKVLQQRDQIKPPFWKFWEKPTWTEWRNVPLIKE